MAASQNLFVERGLLLGVLVGILDRFLALWYRVTRSVHFESDVVLRVLSCGIGRPDEHFDAVHRLLRISIVAIGLDSDERAVRERKRNLRVFGIAFLDRVRASCRIARAY